MKLRSPSCPQQLLFPAALCLLGLAGEVRAQAPQAVVKLKTGVTQQGTITGVTPSGIAIQITGGGAVTLPLNIVDNVQMAAPPEYAQALQAQQQKDDAKAATLINGLAAKYKGLPTDWAQQITAMFGDVALQSGNVLKAEAAYNDFKKLYPAAGSAQTDVGMAAIAVSKKNFVGAKAKITPVIELALKEKNVPLASRFAYSRAFYISGQVKEAGGDKAGALEDYLRTVTIFYHDAASVAAAHERADLLRKQDKVAVP